MIFGQNSDIPTIVEVVGGFGVHIFSRLLHAIPTRLQHTCYPRRPPPQALTAFYRIAFSRKKSCVWNSQKLTSAKPIALVIHLRPKSFQSKSGKNKCYTSGCCDEVASITTANTASTGAIQLSRQQKSKFNQVREYLEFILYWFLVCLI